MKIETDPKVIENGILAPAVRSAEDSLRRVIGSDHPEATANWELRDRYGRRELVLHIRDGEFQTEKAFTYRELRGNGAFDHQLEEMKTALSHVGRWRAAVRKLIDQLEEWSRTLPAATARTTVTLNEENSGKYDLPGLTITSQGDTMRVEPVAGWVMKPGWINSTAVGRVDLKGVGGPIRLYYIEPQEDWVYWARDIDPNASPIICHTLTREDFTKLAEICLRG